MFPMPFPKDISLTHRRVVPTLQLEHELADAGADLVVGFDEVGRGALAGPVMVGATALRSNDLPGLAVPDGLADSKLLTPHRREMLFEPLRSWCAAYAVGSASNTEIDTWGISYALGIAALRALTAIEERLAIGSADYAREDMTANGTGDGNHVSVGAHYMADCGGRHVHDAANTDLMRHACQTRSNGSTPVGGTDCIPDRGYVDGAMDMQNIVTGNSARRVRICAILDGPNDYISNALGTFEAPAVPIAARVTTRIKADQQCACVAAASVIAKVTRDRLMDELAQASNDYAPYQWERNKGYGSAAHRAAIAQFGPTDLHRISWHLI
jgi:ribonuclease HII